MKYASTLMISLYATTLFTGCGNTYTTDLEQKQTRTSISVDNLQEDAIIYLNSLRQKAGMVPFASETHLESAAKNHASYLIANNAFSHNEIQNRALFTGEVPSQRGLYAGYAHGQVSENISSGNASEKQSIDILFSAIYHRFGFLDFSYDEIGVGFAQSESYISKNVYNYDMGISSLRILCEEETTLHESSYYPNICKNQAVKIGVDAYAKALKNTEEINPSVVFWPADQMQGISPVFFEEMPDPLPECKVSGYPISISFNPLKTADVSVDSFKLFDANNHEMKNVKLLNAKNDPNQHLRETEFALMPLHRLEWGSDYHAKISYHDSLGSHEKEVAFKTASLPYPMLRVAQAEEKFSVSVNQTTIFYLPPADCNDILHTFSTSGASANLAFYDANTLMITPTSKGRLEVYPSNGRHFSVEVH